MSDYIALYGADVLPEPPDTHNDPTPPPARPKGHWKNPLHARKAPRGAPANRRMLLLAALAITVGLAAAWTSFRADDGDQTPTTAVVVDAPEPIEACNIIFEVGCIEVSGPPADSGPEPESPSWSQSVGLHQEGLCGKELLEAFKSAIGVGLDWQAADLLLLERLLPAEHVRPIQDRWMELWKREAATGTTLMGERMVLGARLTELIGETGESETSAKVPDDEYFQLRKYLFSASRDALNVQQAFGIDEVWVAVMETTYADHSLTLAALADGDAALWRGTGGGKLADCDNFDTREAAVRFVDEASRSLKRMEPHQPSAPNEALVEEFGEFSPLASLYPLPARDNTRFYIMSRAGLHTVEIPATELDEDRHPLSKLFHLGQHVIAALEGGKE